LSLLTSGRRTAMPRHQTLSATLDWSYQLLPEDERRLLRHLAVFAGDFPLAAALAVAGDADPSLVLLLGNLVAKSLVTFNRRDYRLLDTTRLYASGKLRASGELRDASQRHAQYYRDLFVTAEAEYETQLAVEWHASYARTMSGPRWAGRFPLRAMCRSPSRSRPPLCRCGCSSR
jgi:predicted ATPase